jgi:CubicO group peptidase (beta-lactamase class C family)
VGAFFAEELAKPLDLEFWIGLPAEQQHRVAPLVTWKRPKDPKMAELMDQFMGPDTLLGKALGGVGGLFTDESGVWNLPEVRAAEIPAANGVTNARSLARFYAGITGTVEGGPAEPLLSPEQVTSARECQTSGPDKVLYLDSTFGLGFFTASEMARYGGATAFGHTGAGGPMGFADPDNGIAFGYVMNRMMQSLTGDPRSAGLVGAVYEAVGVEPTFV